MLGAAALLAFTALFHPARPAVGDRIAIDFPRVVTLDPSPRYEVVSRSGARIVIRTFEPEPLVLSGVTSDGVRFRNLVLPIRSVLAPRDSLQPAPLEPPHPLPAARLPRVAIALAALAAAAAWLAVFLLSRRKAAPIDVPADPAEVFRASVAAAARAPQPWAALADATRAYLARRGYGAELTTTQLLRRLDDPLVATILRRGDLEKFSPEGAPEDGFAETARAALELPDRYEPRPVLAEEDAA
jgi:hypothetical protein